MNRDAIVGQLAGMIGLIATATRECNNAIIPHDRANSHFSMNRNRLLWDPFCPIAKINDKRAIIDAATIYIRPIVHIYL